jgi:hypothetical protein
MTFEDVEALCNTVEAIEKDAIYHDGLVTFPAHLLEIVHNVLFPADQRHDYTE